MTDRPWRVRVGNEAERDFVQILRYTLDTFGERQAANYKALLIEALASLSDGPQVPGSRSREEILAGLRTLHVGKRGRPARHFIMYRTSDAQTIDVLRILHDAMDIARHVQGEDE